MTTHKAGDIAHDNQATTTATSTTIATTHEMHENPQKINDTRHHHETMKPRMVQARSENSFFSSG